MRSLPSLQKKGKWYHVSGCDFYGLTADGRTDITTAEQFSCLQSWRCWQQSWDTLWIYKNCPATTAETVNMFKIHFSEAEHSYCSSSGELLWWCHQYARLFVWYSDPAERSKLTLNVCTLLQSLSGSCTVGNCTWGEPSRRTKVCAWCYCAYQKIS